MNPLFNRFKEIWCVDFEFYAPDGHCPEVICMVAKELRSQKVIRLSESRLHGRRKAPFDVGEAALIVAYYASAEMGCFLSLGWPLPQHVLDLYIEFRILRNGSMAVQSYSLLGALEYFGRSVLRVNEKETMRQLAQRGGPWTSTEIKALVEYCEEDVLDTERLFNDMEPHVDVDRALFRGRYVKAVAHMEANGIPIDTARLHGLKKHGRKIQSQLIEEVDLNFGFYDGTTFKIDRFEKYVLEKGLSWPRSERGQLKLDDDTLKDRARAYPELAALRELRKILSQLRENKLAVGIDGRNRTLLSHFKSRTGRNQPSNSKFIFGQPSAFRELIVPERDTALIYCDWSQQELGIAAALSDDQAMMSAYKASDPYLEFAKQAGKAPPYATRASHKEVREQFKMLTLGLQYGMSAETLARTLNIASYEGKELIDIHKKTYSKFWDWSDRTLNHAFLHNYLETVLGWRIEVTAESKERSLRNFPMQANGAEMMRVACVAIVEEGIKLCAPVHDALLIEAPLSQIDETVQKTQYLMKEASKAILSGFELRSDAKIIRYPDHYKAEKGQGVWEIICNLLDEISKKETKP